MNITNITRKFFSGKITKDDENANIDKIIPTLLLSIPIALLRLLKETMNKCLTTNKQRKSFHTHLILLTDFLLDQVNVKNQFF